MNKNIKRTIGALMIAFISIFALSACSTDDADTGKEKGINVVSIEQVVKRMENKETFAFVVASENCEACEVYKESLKLLNEKEDVTLDYIIYEDESEEELIEFLTINLEQDMSQGLGTPTTFFIKDGVSTKNPIIGLVSKDDIVKEYKEGFDKEPRESSINYVTVEEVAKRVAKKESFAFVVGSDTCPACIQFKTNLNTLYEEKGIALDYIDIDEEDDMDLAELLIDDLQLNLSEGLSTPTTLFIIDGKIDGDAIVGALSGEEFTKIYTSYESLLDEEVEEVEEPAEEAEADKEDSE